MIWLIVLVGRKAVNKFPWKKKFISGCLRRFSLHPAGNEGKGSFYDAISESFFCAPRRSRYAAARDKLITQRAGTWSGVDGLSQGVFAQCPEEFRHLPQYDYADQLIIPGADRPAYARAPVQLPPVGAGYGAAGLAEHLYLPRGEQIRGPHLCQDGLRPLRPRYSAGPNTRACLFGTLHVDATIALMDQLEQAGLVTMVGKVNMDRNGAHPAGGQRRGQRPGDAPVG